MIIVDQDAPDPAQTKATVDVVFLSDAIVARREAVRDPREYRKLRDQADRSRRTFLTVEALDAIGDDDLQRRVNEAVSGKDPGTLRATEDHWAS